MVKNC